MQRVMRLLNELLCKFLDRAYWLFFGSLVQELNKSLTAAQFSNLSIEVTGLFKYEGRAIFRDEQNRFFASHRNNASALQPPRWSSDSCEAPSVCQRVLD